MRRDLKLVSYETELASDYFAAVAPNPALSTAEVKSVIETLPRSIITVAALRRDLHIGNSM